MHTVPPSSVVISSSQQSPRSRLTGGADLKVVNITAGAPLTLSCLVGGARPAPKVTWYRDGDLLESCKLGKMDVIN